MKRQPLVLLNGERATFAELGSYPNTMDRHPIDVYSAFYAAAVTDAGGIPVYLPFDADPTTMIDRVDAVLLTGGADVHPALYGADATDVMAGPHPPQPDRDDQEMVLIEAATAADLPILGICRGLQILNVHAGGTLVCDLPDHPKSDPAEAGVHSVSFIEGSALSGLYGDSMAVNSLHHQGIDRLADGWIATGFDHDGRIEAIERLDGRALAVQWHPEMMASRNGHPLFAWLVGQVGVSLSVRSDAEQCRPGAPVLG